MKVAQIFRLQVLLRLLLVLFPKEKLRSLPVSSYLNHSQFPDSCSRLNNAIQCSTPYEAREGITCSLKVMLNACCTHCKRAISSFKQRSRERSLNSSSVSVKSLNNVKDSASYCQIAWARKRKSYPGTCATYHPFPLPVAYITLTED